MAPSHLPGDFSAEQQEKDIKSRKQNSLYCDTIQRIYYSYKLPKPSFITIKKTTEFSLGSK